jgi:preprotein translocase subunit SecF
MTRFFANANYDFIRVRRQAYIVTGVLLAIGLVALLGRRIRYSIEFTGGTLIEARTTGAPWDIEAVRTGLEGAGIASAEITPFGDGHEIAIRAKDVIEGSDANDTQSTAAAIDAVLTGIVGAGQWTRPAAESVSAKVGGELRTQAFMAIFFSFFAVLAYLAWRFEWRFGLASIAATAHDIVLTICFIAIMNLEVSLVVIAALLSMVGYSLNDTIIIFDRVRENMRKDPKHDWVAILNRSINETLPRSVLTHATTFAALLALILVGGETIRPFALVMAFGVFTGTFSSIFIASPVLLFIEQKWPGIGGGGVTIAGKTTRRSAPQSA